MIDRETVDKILDAVDIVDVVSDFVHLRRRGANYIGLCPFHNEKTPSFSVSRSKGICKCFSCGKGGSAVNFIMEHEQMSYYEALKYLAKKYHIEVKERELTDKEKQEQSERENMLVINEFAMKQFEENIYGTDEGRNIGLSYFYERGFNDSIIKKFHLGYSLDNSTALYDTIKKHGFNPKYAIETGLCIHNERGYYDRFKGRVMFPVLNIAGKVIAFGGRTLKKDDRAKYVNSPESTIYKKSNELYGLFQAKRGIVNKDKCFLVEGYTDVLSMHQAGIENVVASSGTSLTEGQIRMIHRFTDNITVLYDGDAAGIKASLRGIDMLLAEGLNVKVLLLPDGDDPDSFAKKHSATEFQDYITAHETDFIRFKTTILLEGLEDDPLKRAAAISDIVKSISVIPSNITRAVYTKECSDKFGIEEKVLVNEVAKAIRKAKEAKEQRKSGQQESVEDDTTEPASESVATASPKKRQDPAEKLLKPYEREVARYIAKYGMCDFCDAYDITGENRKMSVIEYISTELGNDNMSFSIPAYQAIYEKAVSLLPDFYGERPKKEEEIATLRQKLEAEGIEHIRNTIDNIDGIQREEKALQERIDNQIMQEKTLFQSSFLEKKLCSDESDIVRNAAIELVSDKYQLSKVHTKFSNVETEADRLNELIPVAILSWKDAILTFNIRKIQEQIKEAAKAGDLTRMQDLLASQNNLKSLQQQFAKLLGDRVIIP
ncbi:MAG: DNA primase [Bacteroidetes bacterium]|uniref:DNA primase n=1 Tax=Candidatus Limisoma faecipullorum TaxID=2840854 RepID=A0A9D9IMQ6_9BACT|nr:DNA primase [Candidatus Limisoma faecipullorum]